MGIEAVARLQALWQRGPSWEAWRFGCSAVSFNGVTLSRIVMLLLLTRSRLGWWGGAAATQVRTAGATRALPLSSTGAPQRLRLPPSASGAPRPALSTQCLTPSGPVRVPPARPPYTSPSSTIGRKSCRVSNPMTALAACGDARMSRSVHAPLPLPQPALLPPLPCAGGIGWGYVGHGPPLLGVGLLGCVGMGCIGATVGGAGWVRGARERCGEGGGGLPFGDAPGARYCPATFTARYLAEARDAKEAATRPGGQAGAAAAAAATTPTAAADDMQHALRVPARRYPYTGPFSALARGDVLTPLNAPDAVLNSVPFTGTPFAAAYYVLSVERVYPPALTLLPAFTASSAQVRTVRRGERGRGGRGGKAEGLWGRGAHGSQTEGRALLGLVVLFFRPPPTHPLFSRSARRSA